MHGRIVWIRLFHLLQGFSMSPNLKRDQMSQLSSHIRMCTTETFSLTPFSAFDHSSLYQKWCRSLNWVKLDQDVYWKCVWTVLNFGEDTTFLHILTKFGILISTWLQIVPFFLWFSKHFFVFDVRPFLLLSVKFFGCNGNFNGKMTKINKMAKNHFSGV